MAVNDYCTVAEIKAVMPDGNWSTTYDTLLAALATRASRAIDRYLKRKPGAFYVSANVTQYFDGSGERELWIGELAAAPTSVHVAETGDICTPTLTAWASTDYVCWPYNALDEGRPYLRLDIDQLNGSKVVWYAYPKAVKIVGKFGYAVAVPDDVKQAACVQAARWFKRGQQAFQDTGAVVELGQLTYTQRLDPDVANLIDWLAPVTV
jgi:hypothetical protein